MFRCEGATPTLIASKIPESLESFEPKPAFQLIVRNQNTQETMVEYDENKKAYIVKEEDEIAEIWTWSDGYCSKGLLVDKECRLYRIRESQ